MDEDDSDPVVDAIPIRLSTKLAPDIHIHQFPLLNRPLQVPPSAAAAGKSIASRVKPNTRRMEIHVPSDTRPGFWNVDRAHDLGSARVRDDREKNQEPVSVKSSASQPPPPRLEEVRLRSEQISMQGAYMLGVMNNTTHELHLHPIGEMHQFRPTLTYLDVLSAKKRKGEEESDEEDGPPPDPDEPNIPSAPPKRKEKKIDASDAKEVQVSARKADVDFAGRSAAASGQGLSIVRREMLQVLRAEEDEQWQQLQYCDEDTFEATTAFENLYSTSSDQLECKTAFKQFLADIPGLRQES